MTERTPARRVALGCTGCLGVALALIALAVLGVVIAFWRREGDPVRFELHVDPGGLPPTATVRASYRPEADIPFVTRGFMGSVTSTTITTSATTENGTLSFEVVDGWRSVRDERLELAELADSWPSISFAPVQHPEPFGPPELRSGGYVNAAEWAEREGDVATYRGNAFFVPSMIQYDAAVHTVRALLEVRAVDVTRTSPDNQITAPPGVMTDVQVTVERSGDTWATAGRLDAHPQGAAVEAIILTEADLLGTLGWRASHIGIPVTRAEWQALRTHANAGFALTVETTATGATVHFTTPSDLDEAPTWHLLTIAFDPGDDLAGASESYLSFSTDEDEGDFDDDDDDVAE